MLFFSYKLFTLCGHREHMVRMIGTFGVEFRVMGADFRYISLCADFRNTSCLMFYFPSYLYILVF